jgi:hypothetical protein
MVHHIDGNAKNLNSENLVAMNMTCHRKLHARQGDMFKDGGGGV